MFDISRAEDNPKRREGMIEVERMPIWTSVKYTPNIAEFPWVASQLQLASSTSPQAASRGFSGHRDSPPWG